MTSVNPVISREITERLRSLRAFVMVSVFVVVLALTTFLVYAAAQSAQDSFDLASRTQVGRLVFETVLLIMTILVLFVVPGVTAGAIAGERERQTLTTLQVTLLRPRSILAGKVVAALAFLVLLLVAALPVLAVAYVLGGIRVLDIGIGLAAVAFLALVLAAMTVALSAFVKRVQGATVLAYAFTALLLVAGPIAFAAASILDARADNGDDVAAPALLLTPNPIVFVASAVGDPAYGSDGPLSAIDSAVTDAWGNNDRSWIKLFPNAAPFDRGGLDAPQPSPPAWQWSALSMLTLAVIMGLLGARRLEAPAEVER